MQGNLTLQGVGGGFTLPQPFVPVLLPLPQTAFSRGAALGAGDTMAAAVR